MTGANSGPNSGPENDPDSGQETAARTNPQGPGFLVLVRLFPVVFGTLAVAVVMLPWSLQAGQWASPVLRAMAIIDPYAVPALASDQRGVLAELVAVLGQGEVWRLITPAFLHFDFMHIAFNGAIVYMLGQRLELRLGTAWMLVFVICSAALSNVGQLWWSGQVFFGGLSGVGFALLGGLIALGWLRPSDPAFALPRQFVGGILLFLIVFSTGVTEAFGLHIANAAHWAGLGTGLGLGLMMHLVVPHARV